MRRGITLVEALAVLIVIAVLLFLLWPTGHHGHEERRTQCRSNLRQIGLALTIYANDCRGWTPAHYGSASVSEDGERTFVWGDGAPNEPNLNWQAWMLTRSVYVGASERDSATDDLCGDFNEGAGEGWLPYKGAGGNPGAYGGGLGVDERIKDPDGSARRTAMITGLGLLFSGGYLTQQGGQALVCPSWTVAMETRRLGDALENLFVQDNREPFWSLGDIPCWDSDDADGDGDPTTGMDASTNGNGIQDLAAVLWGPEGDGGRTFSERGGQPCDWLVTNYWLRMKTEKHGSFKFESNSGLAMVSDTLLGNFDGVIASHRVRGADGTGDPRRNGDAGDGGGFIANHDGAYNVLFADGSVKTFSDASQVVRNVTTATDDEASSGDGKNYTFVAAGNAEQNDVSRTENVFPVYFDPIYQQD